jgi:putative sporulation protein YtaF
MGGSGNSIASRSASAAPSSRTTVSDCPAAAARVANRSSANALPSRSSCSRPDKLERPPEDAGRVSLRQILSDLTRADQNRSRDIDAREATLLAVAVSLNNLGGGVGAGLAHLSTLWMALSSAVVSFLVVWLGAWTGGRLGGARLGKQAQTIAGLLLVLVGLWQLH